MEKMLLTNVTIDEIISQFRSALKEELALKNKEILGEKFLSPSQVCQMFQPSISKVSLSAWTKAGRLTAHRMGGRIYYKHSEVVDAVTHIKKYKRVEY
jgi:hypothetical protein